MISVYENNEIDFSHNGIKVIDNILKSCYITQEINGDYSLELETFKDDNGKSECLKGLNIIKADGKLFRIPFITNEQSGLSKSITARHIFYDLSNDFNNDTRATNKSVHDALVIAVAVNPKFSVLACDDLGLNNANFIEENPVSGIYDKILTRWGGELQRDNYNLSVKQRLGTDTGRLISYGKDIVGFTQTLDYSTLATRILLKGKDGLTIDLVNGGSKYLTSPLVDNYPFIITKKVEFTDIEDATELKNKGLSLWGTIDIPSANYKINLVDVQGTEEYKQFEQLQELQLGDTIIVKHKIFKVNLLARVIKIKKNILTNKIEEIELGQFKNNIATHFKLMSDKISYAKNGVQETKEDLKVTKTTVFQNEEQISLQAQAVNALDGRVENAELKITADAIVSTVTSSTTYTDAQGLKTNKATIISEINQTAEAISISASKLDLTGLVTIANIGTPGTTVIDGGNITSGLIKGIEIQQVSGNKILAKLYKNLNGGMVLVNDTNGNRNVSIGAESGDATSGNVGGTLILYNDDTLKPRLSLGIASSSGCGYANLNDNEGNLRVQLDADITGFGSGMICMDASRVVKSWISETSGSINEEKIATQAWVTANFVHK